jgi:hypothetical protein
MSNLLNLAEISVAFAKQTDVPFVVDGDITSKVSFSKRTGLLLNVSIGAQFESVIRQFGTKEGLGAKMAIVTMNFESEFLKSNHWISVILPDKPRDFDDAELVWDYLFSGTRRDENGNIVHEEPLEPRKGDAFAIALRAGCDKAYVNNKLVHMSGPAIKRQKLKYHGLNGGSIVRGEYLCVPVSFVADVFGGKLEQTDGGLAAVLTLPDGRTLQFARGSIGCVVNNTVRSMLCDAVYANGELHVPIQWICQSLFHHFASTCEDVLYITDHYAVLSKNMAHLIRDEILV